MKSKDALCGVSIAVLLHFGVLAGSAQTTMYLYAGYETNITLAAGTYIITAHEISHFPVRFPSRIPHWLTAGKFVRPLKTKETGPWATKDTADNYRNKS